MAMKLLTNIRLFAIVGELVMIFMNLLLACYIKRGIFMQPLVWRCGSCPVKSRNAIVAEQLRSAWMVVMNGLIMVCECQTELAWVAMEKYSRRTIRENGFPVIN